MSNETIPAGSAEHPTGPAAKTFEDELIQKVSQWIAPLGYQVIHIEVQSHRQKTFRIFIDYLESSPDKTIGIEDCVKVSKSIDEILDQAQEIDQIFTGTYELEISSPGVDRPLRSLQDFQRFTGRDVKIHTYRPLTAEEIDNPLYLEKNPKQKNFLGKLLGLRDGKVILNLSPGGSELSLNKVKSKKKALPKTNSVEGLEISIPLPLISKANLEPVFDFESSDESENRT
jgi:ribosome maturation factor RimP